jgi:hypothetical protein
MSWTADGSFLFEDSVTPEQRAVVEAVAAAHNPTPAPTVTEQLKALDAANLLTQRNLRETVMLMAEAFKQITGGTVDLSAIPGVAKVYEVEAEAAALRALL